MIEGLPPLNLRLSGSASFHRGEVEDLAEWERGSQRIDHTGPLCEELLKTLYPGG